MGQYLQMGICNRIVIEKERMNKLNISIEKVIESINEEMDISLFEQSETEEQFVFTINESIVLEQLQVFLMFLFSLYTQENPYKESFDTVLKMVSECSSLQEIEEMAKNKSFPCFQRNIIDDELMVNEWYWLRIEYSIWVMFVEGKIYMESYNNFLRFLERQVREVGKEWTISGVFRCFIQ
jgi:hypothetical protein